MAAYNYHARVLGRIDPELDRFFCTALQAVGDPGQTTDALWQLVQATGEASYRCMELLDAANTGAFGDPEPVQVPLTIEKGPFIVIHRDLRPRPLRRIAAAEQTAGRGNNAHTHSEMLKPAHGYPELKRRYPTPQGQLWHRMAEPAAGEFEDIPAPIPFTTNRIMPPARQLRRPGEVHHPVVAYPGVPPHRRRARLFPVIEKALSWRLRSGHPAARPERRLHGDHRFCTARRAAARGRDRRQCDGKLRHFFLGGRDGTPAQPPLLHRVCPPYPARHHPAGPWPAASSARTTCPGTVCGHRPARASHLDQCNDATAPSASHWRWPTPGCGGVNDLPLAGAVLV